MIWMMFIGVLVVVLLFILWQMEQIGKANKELRAKLQSRDQEIVKLQQAAYQLAEQQKTVLEQQLSRQPVHSLLTAVEIQLARLLCVSLPAVIKDCVSKSQTPQQAMASQMRRQTSSLTVGQLEQMMQSHSRLTALWRNNTVVSHLQLCTVVAALATEEAQAKSSS
jgi:hypothetical protein